MIRWHSIQGKGMCFKLRQFESKAFSFGMVCIRRSLNTREAKRSKSDSEERSRCVPLSLEKKIGQKSVLYRCE